MPDRGDLSISDTADLLGFSHTTVPSVYREQCKKNKKHPVSGRSVGFLLMRDVRGQWPDRKATVTQITRRYDRLWWAQVH